MIQFGRETPSLLSHLLKVRNLATQFPTREGLVRAVDGVSFYLDRGELLGLVGESGCGKSITALSIMRLVAPPGRIVAGEILFDGRDLLKLSNREMRELAVLLVTHDLGVGAEVADGVGVMDTGKVGEESQVDELFAQPKHPYPEGLLRSVPKLTAKDVVKQERLQTIEGMVPRPNA